MGVFKWVNRVIFGAESVAKSAAGKAKQKGEETLDKAEDMFEDLADKAEDAFDKGKSRAKAEGGKLKARAEEYKDKAEDFVEDLVDDIKPTFDEAKDIVSGAAHKVKDKTGEFVDKAKHKYDEVRDKRQQHNDPTDNPETASSASESEQPVSDMMDDLADDAANPQAKADQERGEEFVDRLKNVAEATGAKILGTDDHPGAKQDPVVDKAADFVSEKFEKAKDLADKAGDKIREKMDETLKKAKELEEQEAREEAENPTGIREDSTHADALKGSTLSGTDDFFEKAKRFADGDYSGAQEGRMEIKSNDDAQPNENKGKVKGFEDLDGDGDEVIDDAIIDNDDESEGSEDKEDK